MGRPVSTKAPSQDLSAMYAEAKKAGAKGVTWAGIAGQGQVLVAQKADGTYSAFDKSGHEQKLGAAATPEAAHDIAVAALQSGKSTLSNLASLDMAGLSQATKEKLNSANGGNVQQGAGDTSETGSGEQVLNPTDSTATKPQTTAAPKPTTTTKPVNSTDKFQKINFNGQISKYIVGRQSIDGNKTVALVVKDPTTPNTYYAVGDNQAIEFKSESDEAANKQANEYLKNNQLKPKSVNSITSKNSLDSTSKGSETESSQQVLDAANAKGQAIIDNTISGN